MAGPLSRVRDARRSPAPEHPRPRREHARRPSSPRHPRASLHGPGQARIPEPGWLGQGPDRGRDGRRCGASGPSEARGHDRGSDQRKHRRGSRAGGGRSGLPGRLRPPRQDEHREDPTPSSLRRPRGGHAERARARPSHEPLLGGPAARARDPGRLLSEPVREPGKPGRPLPDHRARDRSGWRPRARCRHRHGRYGGHLERGGAVLQGAPAGRADRRGRSRGLPPRAVLPDSVLWARRRRTRSRELERT